MLDLPPKPDNRCYYCHAPFEYEWYSFEQDGVAEGELVGFWQELPCETCRVRRAELADYLESLSENDEIELTSQDLALIEGVRHARESELD